MTKQKINFTTLILLLPSIAISELNLPVPIQSALNHRRVPDQALSIYVEDLRSGAEVLHWNTEEPRNPASVEKMVTTLVALDSLGPAYRWKTEVSIIGDIADGILDGDLLIKGYGDPYLVIDRFWQLLRRVRQNGIVSISGNLLIDDSYFDVGDYDPAAFDNEPLRAYNVAPNALLTNFKVIRYSFQPDSSGSRVNIFSEPPLDNVEIVNRLRLTNGACKGYQRGITITPSKDLGRFTFSGRFPRDCENYAMDRTVLSHNEFTYGLFKSLWLESGGHFAGNWKNVVADGELEPIISFDSLPLSEVIAKVNKHSNNVMAKQLLLTLAAEKYGVAGTAVKGRQAVSEWLIEHGMNFRYFNIDNGAGLSRDSKITAKDLGVLLRFAFDSPYMPEYISSLSLAGLDGTLSRRFRDTDLIGQAHMKTGSLDDVSTMAGYFQSRSGKRYIVVSMLNYKDVHRGPGKEVQEMLLRWLYDQ